MSKAPMNRSNMAKILTAFVAGVVLTMGSLVYSKRQELSDFRKAPRTAGSSAAVAPTQASASADPAQTPRIGSEGVKPSHETVERTSEDRVPTQVPKPAVPKAARSDRVRNGSSVTAENRVRAGTPNALAEAPSPASAANDDKWRALPQTNPVPAQATPARLSPTVVTLQPGTSLSIRLEQSVSTDRNRSGDMFRGSLDSPLILNGFVLAERGAPVVGQIEKAKRARLLGSRADLSLRLTEVRMADGQQVAIQTSSWEEKGTHGSIGDTPKIAAGAALGAVVGALSGAAKGAGFVRDNAGARKPALTGAKKRSLVLTTGARFTFRVATPITITEWLAPVN
jgi:hypothetical protein